MQSVHDQQILLKIFRLWQPLTLTSISDAYPEENYVLIKHFLKVFALFYFTIVYKPSIQTSLSKSRVTVFDDNPADKLLRLLMEPPELCEPSLAD